MATTDGGGNPRFKGPGMQWKTPWKGKHPYTGMPFWTDFTHRSAPPQPHYNTAINGGLTGSPAGFWIATVLFIRPLTLGNVPASFGDPALPTAGGWAISVVTADPTHVGISFSVSDGAAFTSTSITVPNESAISNPSEVDPALVIPVLGIMDPGALNITVYAGSVGFHQTEGFAGPYVVPVPGIQTMGSDYTTSTGSPDLGINGLTGGNGVPIFAQVNAWFDAVKADLKIASIPGITDRLWAANDFIAGNVQQEDAPTPIADEIANESMILVDPDDTVRIIRYNVFFDY